MIRVVVDNNVLISGLFWDAIPEQIYKAAEKQYTLLTSTELVGELNYVLSRIKFANRFALINRTVDQVIDIYLKTAERVIAAEVAENSVRDLKDRMVLATAAGGKADYIVTGDKDLLILERYQRVQILSPAQFLMVLADQPN